MLVLLFSALQLLYNIFYLAAVQGVGLIRICPPRNLSSEGLSGLLTTEHAMPSVTEGEGLLHWDLSIVRSPLMKVPMVWCTRERVVEERLSVVSSISTNI